MAELTANPQLLLLLANLGRPRRPSGVAAAYAEPILPDVTVASAQLAEVVDQPVATADLADLRDFNGRRSTPPRRFSSARLWTVLRSMRSPPTAPRTSHSS